MNQNPNKKQREWHDWLRNEGCFICSCEPLIHHIKGSKMKLKGVIKPGEWYVIPLCYKHHQGERGVHTSKKKFLKDYGTEKEVFEMIVREYEFNNNEKPMTEEEYQIIMDRA